MKTIPFSSPDIQDSDLKAVESVIRSGWLAHGKYSKRLEDLFCEYTGAKYAIATVNGTAALHIALELIGVTDGDEVITQPLSFIASCNAISYCGAKPVFVDVDSDTMGLSPDSLLSFLKQYAEQREEDCYNKVTGNRISAVLPMHTFGHPCRIDEIAAICDEYNIPLVEDAAESLGSFYKNKHTGTFGCIAALSFNGNKTITTGGGGMILTNDEVLAKRAKHITTTAKVPHPYEFIHDEIGYNFRLPNINAALGCAQMESLAAILQNKRELATRYERFFADKDIQVVKEPENAISNYWLNAVILKDKSNRDEFLQKTNSAGVMTRPIWQLMNRLDMFKHCLAADLTNSHWLEERVVNIPSGVRL